jgi:NADP-dependent 3-hydroxy acid dehydrogenase YdfG
MEFMKELMNEAEKKKVSRKAAASVYHRDYMRTRNKKYRKYDPRKHADQQNESVEAEVENSDIIEEGMWDFIKGAGRETVKTAQHMAGPIIAAGRRESHMGKLARELTALADLLITYDQQKPKREPNVVRTRDDARRQQPEVPQQTQQSQPKQQGSTVPTAFKTTEKPRMRQGNHGLEFQFSSYLASLDDDVFITEGIWDFIKGAGREFAQGVTKDIKQAGSQVAQVGRDTAQSISQTVKQAGEAGRQASQEADSTRVQRTAQEKVAEIVKILQKLGQGALDQLQTLAQRQCGTQARRVVTVIMNAAKNMGVQLA